MTKKFILVAGNIGAGKTSLTTRLGDHLGWQTGYESVHNNPFLADFYSDMTRWSFHLQVFFLGHRAQQHQHLFDAAQSAISDRSIYEDAHIFARVLHHLGHMSDRDYAAYNTVYELVISGLPKPNLLLYLECPVDRLIQRIQARGREMESGISAEYLHTLDRFYKDWIETFDLCPVVTIPSSDLNFVHREDHLKIVVDHIESRLSGHENVVFP